MLKVKEIYVIWDSNGRFIPGFICNLSKDTLALTKIWSLVHGLHLVRNV